MGTKGKRTKSRKYTLTQTSVIGFFIILLVSLPLFLMLIPNVNLVSSLTRTFSPETYDSISFISENSELPDLIITDIWLHNNLIYYQIQNIGNATATSRSGHYTFLFIDDINITSSWVSIALESGERWEGFFDYPWVSTELKDQVDVFADYLDAIAETNESNNSRKEIWKSDATPPKIIVGPKVDMTTSNSAVVSWVTDEECNSAIKYSKTARYTCEETDPVQTREHEISLTELEPSTAYQFFVQSTDNSGNMVESKEKWFETLPEFDDTAPNVALVNPEEFQGITKVTAEASDNVGIEKVEFYMDNKLLFTDYSPPYEYSLNTTKLSNGEHLLKAVAYDLFEGSTTEDLKVDVVNIIDETLPTVTITSPNNGDPLTAGKIRVNATLTDDTGLAQAYFRVSFQGEEAEFEGFMGFPDYPKSQKVTFEWDARFLKGSYRLSVEVFDKEAKSSYATCDVDVVAAPLPTQPKLKIKEHEVTRQDNFFKIGLIVENIGDADATNIFIEDFLCGFQPISKTSTNAEYTAEFLPSSVCGECTISLTGKIQKQGGSVYLSFNAVPFLFHPNPLLPLKLDPSIGNPVRLWYNGPDGTKYYEEFHIPVPKTTTGDTIPAAHAKALKSADYLIVTNPERLFWYKGTTSTLKDDVNDLLSTMAELAYYKLGALGYLYDYDRDTFSSLIYEGGLWNSKLGGNSGSPWSSAGYLLIVGETEIVPAYGNMYFGTLYTQAGNVKADRPIIADCTDYPYASTCGLWIKPELSIGRIIGNSAKELKKPIETSINVHKGVTGYGFDKATFFAVAGYPEGLGGGAAPISCTKEVNDVSQILTNEGVKGVKMFNSDYIQYIPYIYPLEVNETTTKINILNGFFGYAPNRDIIFLSGHGNPSSWDVINTADITNRVNLLGSSNPIVFVSSCGTGTYTASYSMAEAFLSQGAGVYYGATKWGLDTHTSINKKVFEKWDAGESFALAVMQTKQCISDSISDKYWIAIYHVFGDPKFGWESSQINNTDSSTQGLTQAASSIDVAIPNYEVIQVEGRDYVEIPGGQTLFTPGTPIIPYYQVLIEYPKNYEIQDVTLANKSEPTSISGLNIPKFMIDNIGVTPVYYESPNQFQYSENLDWWPNRIFNWTTFESPDGTILVITLFPFCYNHLTTNAEFYSNFNFDVDFTVSSVQIADVKMNKYVYNLGEPVFFDLELNNLGLDGNDVVISAVIMKGGSDEIVDGLLLRKLKNLSGHSSCSLVWESSGFESGFYTVIVELKDEQGNMFDRKISGFNLGIVSGEFTSVTVTPEHFQIGDKIEIQMTFSNTGTEKINGSAIVEILDSSGNMVGEFRYNITDLAPSKLITLSNTWDTSGKTEGSYNVVGHVFYDGKSASFANVTLSTEEKSTPTHPPIGILVLIVAIILIAIAVIAFLWKRK